LIVEVQGAQALVELSCLMPTSSPVDDAVFQHQSNSSNGKLVVFEPAQTRPSSASA
jgi:hypothetical protein